MAADLTGGIRHWPGLTTSILRPTSVAACVELGSARDLRIRVGARPRPRHCSRHRRAWLLVAACSWLSPGPAEGAQDTAAGEVVEAALESRDIEYFMPEAGRVVLVWGAPGWSRVPSESRPEGTWVENGLMHTPMQRQGGSHRVQVRVPPGSDMEYGFLVQETLAGRPVDVWVIRPDTPWLLALLLLALVSALGWRGGRPRHAPEDAIDVDSIARPAVVRAAIPMVTVNVLLIATTMVFSLLVGTNAVDWEAAASFVKYDLLALSLASENTLATWYSSMLFLSVAVAATACYARDEAAVSSGEGRRSTVGWLILAVAFLTLSLDEMGSIHERLGEISSLTGGERTLGWVVVLAVPIGVCGALMLAFAYSKLRTDYWAMRLAAVGTLFFLANPVLEQIEFSMLTSGQELSRSWTYALRLATEEGTELFGALFWLLSLLFYLSNRTDSEERVRVTSKRVPVPESVLAALPVIFCGGLLITAVFVRLTLPADVGVPRNWFAASAALLSTWVWWVRQRALEKPAGMTDPAFAVAAALGIAISVGFGMATPGRLITADPSMTGHMTRWILATAIAYVGWQRGAHQDWRIALSAMSWVVLMLVALFVEPEMMALLVCGAYAALMTSLSDPRPETYLPLAQRRRARSVGERPIPTGDVSWSTTVPEG